MWLEYADDLDDDELAEIGRALLKMAAEMEPFTRGVPCLIDFESVLKRCALAKLGEIHEDVLSEEGD